MLSVVYKMILLLSCIQRGLLTPRANKMSVITAEKLSAYLTTKRTSMFGRLAM